MLPYKQLSVCDCVYYNYVGREDYVGLSTQMPSHQEGGKPVIGWDKTYTGGPIHVVAVLVHILLLCGITQQGSDCHAHMCDGILRFISP